jgi:hypothetical protein
MLVKDSFDQLMHPDVYLENYDCLHLDITAMTCKMPRLWEVYKKATTAGMPLIWFVDSAISKYWLHKKTYTDFYGVPINDMRDYFIAYNDRLRKMGYHIDCLYREGTVCYGMITPGRGEDIPPAATYIERP